MDTDKINRINALYKKSQTEGLNEQEAKEQALLRKEYIDLVRKNLRGQLDQIDLEEEDGKIVNLGEKYGNVDKKGN